MQMIFHYAAHITEGEDQPLVMLKQLYRLLQRYPKPQVGPWRLQTPPLQGQNQVQSLSVWHWYGMLILGSLARLQCVVRLTLSQSEPIF